MSSPPPPLRQRAQRLRHCHHFLVIRNNHTIVSASELALFASHFKEANNDSIVVQMVMNMSRSTPNNILYVQTRYGLTNPRKAIAKALQKYNTFAKGHGLQCVEILSVDSEFSLSRNLRDSSRYGHILRGCSSVEVNIKWQNETFSEQREKEDSDTRGVTVTSDAPTTTHKRKRWTTRIETLEREITRLQSVLKTLQEENTRLRHQNMNTKGSLAMAGVV